MFVKLLKTAPIVLLATAAAVWSIGWGSTPAYAQHDGSTGHVDHAGHDAASSAHQHGSAPDDHANEDRPAPHGGQLTTATPLTFEVLYQPREIRVYVYGAMPSPESAKDVTGEVSLRRRNDKRATSVVLRYAAPPAGQQDYLSAPVDLSRVKEGDLTATIKLANLPLANHPGISFAQAVVVSRAKLQVVLAALEQSDQAGIRRQRVCPVMGAPLGSMGDPIKVLVGGQPVYLCCKGCVAKVKNAPEAYLAKVGQLHQSH